MAFSRRDFLRATAASAALASIDASIGTKGVEALEGYGLDWHKSVCRYCGVGCGVMLGVENGRPVAIRGDRANPINRGLLCVKGYHVGLALYGSDRLTTPLLKKGDKHVPISWEEAIDIVARSHASLMRGLAPPTGPPAFLTHTRGMSALANAIAERLKAGAGHPVGEHAIEYLVVVERAAAARG